MIDVSKTANELSPNSYELSTNLREINSRIEIPAEISSEKSKLDAGTEQNPRYIITRNECLEGDRHPITGVEFEKKTVETPSGEYVEGVFPKFESKFKAEIPRALYEDTDKNQFKECNKQLLAKIEKDPDLKKQFTDDQIEQIKEGTKDGSAPDGYVWHHEPESGVLALVDSETHARTGHTGGRSIWGGGSDNR